MWLPVTLRYDFWPSRLTKADMINPNIIDLNQLVDDIRLTAKYASRVGVLRDKSILAELESAELAVSSGQRPNVQALAIALNDLVKLIAPMSLADLECGRDPFSAENQRKSRNIQLVLTFFTLIVLVAIGYFMHSLHREQEALQTIEKIQDMRPQQKLTELRRLAQWDNPLGLPATPRLLNDQYHEKTAELMRINSQVMNSYTTALVAADIPLFPFEKFFKSPAASYVPPQNQLSAQSNETSRLPKPVNPNDVNNGNAVEKEILKALSEKTEAATLVEPQPTNICTEEQNGEMRLPEQSKSYPKWMKTALVDSLNDFCFQLNVLAPGGAGVLLSRTPYQLEFNDTIKEKISLRVLWFLPFLFGLLGSSIFLMRNIASVRTPSMDWFPVIMRIALGGVAGIVVGWFLSSNSTPVSNINVISVPFALAFLTGYGIDVLFTLLDKFNKSIGEPAHKG
jgi:hypothetical protein